MSIPVVVVGSAQSGAGKTTATLALIAGLRGRGLKVQPFKVGPDYLDPSLLTWVAGRACRSLDAWMLGESQLLELFHRASQGADIAVVEGVMGLFDDRIGTGRRASTAAVASELGASVVLVLDARASSQTVGAVAAGLAADPGVRLAGVVLNRVASERHLLACTQGLRERGLPFLGSLPRDATLARPDRYLGLVSSAETAPPPAFRRRLAAAAARLDIEAIVRRALPATSRHPGPPRLFPAEPQSRQARIAVARDHAFHFYYRDALDLLEAWGAELVPFSPLSDASVPVGVDAIYIGGGYPELFAEQLSGNEPMRRSLRASYRSGALVYAECGGAMYLGAAMEDADGRRHRMVGLWPGRTRMKPPRLRVGYRRVRAVAPNFFGSAVLSGHEFHYSHLRTSTRPWPPAWEILDEGGGLEGFSAARLVASYIHLHLGSEAGLAAAFVAACRTP